MALDVLLGAVLSLVVLAAFVYLLLRRAPLVFVADKLSSGLFSGADEVDELFQGSDGVDEAGPDRGTSNDFDEPEKPEFDPSVRLGGRRPGHGGGPGSADVDSDRRDDS